MKRFDCLKVIDSLATAHGADLEAIAKGSGIKRSLTISTIEEFAERIKVVFDEKGLCLLVAEIKTGTVGT